MTVPSAFGVLASGSAASTSFVTAASYTPGGASQVVTFAGAAAGNLALVVVSFASGTATPAGWTLVGSYTWVAFGYVQSVYSKVLTSGDISTGSVTFTSTQNGGTVMAAFYAGPTVATIVSTSDGTPDAAMPGFTKNAACKALVAYATDRSPTSSITAPGTMTARIAPFVSVFFVSRLDDILTVSNYTNGSTLTYAGTGIFEIVGQVIELT